jgi:archaellum component FlaG (FlaF/FlaG flagellin family)
MHSKNPLRQLLNSSGFPFQLRTKAEISAVRSSHGWRVRDKKFAYAMVMKKIFTAAVLSFALASSALAECSGNLVTSVKDRFSGVTRTKTRFQAAWGPATPNLYAFTSGKDTTFAIIFSNLTEEWHYLRCATTFVLADDKPVAGRVVKEITSGGAGIEASAKATQEKVLADALAEAKSHPKHLLAHVVLAETVTVQIDPDSVAQLGTASKIEFKICNDEIMASPEFVTAAHEFACKVAQSGGPVTPSPAGAPVPPGAPPSGDIKPPEGLSPGR